MSADKPTGKAAGLAEARRRFGLSPAATDNPEQPDETAMPPTMPPRSTSADGLAEARRRFGPRPNGGDTA